MSIPAIDLEGGIPACALCEVIIPYHDDKSHAFVWKPIQATYDDFADITPYEPDGGPKARAQAEGRAMLQDGRVRPLNSAHLAIEYGVGGGLTPGGLYVEQDPRWPRVFATVAWAALDHPFLRVGSRVVFERFAADSDLVFTTSEGIASFPQLHTQDVIAFFDRAGDCWPASGRLFVQPDPETSESPGGVIIPETSRRRARTGVVITAGPNTTTRPGERVVHNNGYGTGITVGAQSILVMDEDRLLAIVDP